MKAYNYKCMEFENYKVFVHSQNVMCMELGGKGIHDQSFREEMVKMSKEAFDQVAPEVEETFEDVADVQMFLHIFNSPENDMWSIGRNIIFSMSNSPRPDDRWHNGYECILEAVKEASKTKAKAFPAILFVTPHNYYLYLNGKPACHGSPNILPILNKDHPSPDDSLRNPKHDTPFYFLKNSIESYQCSDIIVNINDAEHRKEARKCFKGIIENARTYLQIPKDRRIFGVLTTYTDDFEANKEDYQSAYEYAVDFVVYALNYGDDNAFNREILENIIHETVKKEPEVQNHYVFLDILSPTNLAITYNDTMYAIISAPENWHDVLIDITRAEDSDDDEDNDDMEINPYG